MSSALPTVGSAVAGGALHEALDRIGLPPAATVVELGTFLGASAAVLAEYAETVLTFDLRRRAEAVDLWGFLGSAGRIRYFPYPKGDRLPKRPEAARTAGYRNWVRRNLARELDGRRAALAFVDAGHDYENVRADCELAGEFADAALVHDWFDKFPGVGRLCSELGAERIGKFGLVRLIP